MTEIGGICTLSHFGCNKMTSVGVPLPGMLVKVIFPFIGSHFRFSLRKMLSKGKYSHTLASKYSLHCNG